RYVLEEIMLLHTKYRNVVKKVSILNDYKKQIEDEDVKEEISNIYQEINENYNDFVKKHPDIYYSESNGFFKKTIDKHQDDLYKVFDKAIEKVTKENKEKLKKEKESNEKYGIEILKISSIFVGAISLSLLVFHVVFNGYSLTHPFSLLLVGLILPSISIVVPSKLCQFFVGIGGLLMAIYSTLNLPTNDSLILANSINSMTNMPTTVLQSYTCGNNCKDYTEGEIRMLKDALNKEAARILESRRK
ncbi:hypothetical protein, partial [Vibrio sp. Vb2960]|uniref:hypothetical protein n=1 Tax=Vibrio sp. Vb2960 TaxID=3074693 RepID=UPI002964856B